MSTPIVHREPSLEEIRRGIREAPLPSLREMLTDEMIVEACEACGYAFRRRLYDPVVTVYHFLLQAVGREESYASTWQELWAPLAARFPELASCSPGRSGLTRARGRLPRAVMDRLAREVCRTTPESTANRWKGLRLRAIDVTYIAMPREDELAEHFGLHRARKLTVHNPLARFASLLDVGTSTIIEWNFGPYRKGEPEFAQPLIERLGKGDLGLIDRGLTGSPTMARILAGGADFLGRKNARLNVEKVKVVDHLGRDDFIVEIPVSRPARRKDPSLPRTVRVRLFKATWKAPTREKLTEWFVTSLVDAKRFTKRKLAKLYHERWRIETSYLEFKQVFHAAVLRSKRVDNAYKEIAAHVLAYQLVRRLMVEAAGKHGKKPTSLSFLNAARWTMSFSHEMASAPAWALPVLYQRLLDAIAADGVEVRPGRIEPRRVVRNRTRYGRLKITRRKWRRRRLRRAG